jgi:hypothetical protein
VRALAGHLAASGWGARGAFGLAALAALAVQTLGVVIDPAPERPGPASVAPAEGSALARPLFDPSRRPWTAEGSRALLLRPDPAAPVLVLRGLRRDGEQALAYIDDGSGDRAWLAPGEGRGDWRIAAIGPSRITVLQRGERFEAEFLGHPATLRPAPFADAPPALRP